MHWLIISRCDPFQEQVHGERKLLKLGQSFKIQWAEVIIFPVIQLLLYTRHTVPATLHTSFQILRQTFNVSVKM